MFVLSDFTQEMDTLCEVVFEDNGLSPDISHEASAIVVRGDEEGLAIKFTFMAHETYNFLQVALLYESDDPLYICLEFPEDYSARQTGKTPIQE